MEDGVTITTLVRTQAVETSRWADLNFSELLEQKNIMFNRYEYLVNIGNGPAAKGILEGINKLDVIIAQKTVK